MVWTKPSFRLQHLWTMCWNLNLSTSLKLRTCFLLGLLWMWLQLSSNQLWPASITAEDKTSIPTAWFCHHHVSGWQCVVKYCLHVGLIQRPELLSSHAVSCLLRMSQQAWHSILLKLAFFLPLFMIAGFLSLCLTVILLAMMVLPEFWSSATVHELSWLPLCQMLSLPGLSF